MGPAVTIDANTTISLWAVVFLLLPLAGLWWRMETRIRSTEDNLSTYKLYVAQNHVSMAALKETEDRLVNAFDKLTSRIEAVVVRLDKLALAAGRHDEE